MTSYFGMYFKSRHNKGFAGVVLLLILGVLALAKANDAQDAADAKPVPVQGTLNQVMQAMQDNAEKTVSSPAKLKIVQGFCGADGAWRDVTDVLQNSLKDNRLQVSWQQPYSEIGGDPAYGKIKTLLVTYCINGKTRIAAFSEWEGSSGLKAIIP